ncbi:response regulator transcription factor [Chitinophagaceae bacterium LB-8]|uniref:Response regulator transcription factor n=1 Tax=Paraflavisolibacter caeni TaxID=2982496 RepID=A0A9X3BJD1_9BACT|nr:response regulator transcription factor [Paraflavisolibacter caeni]MCU7551033.1 response regulator transcription factor [Paraflavisolibacter caeni]
MKKFLIIDDHEIVRRGLKLLISDFYPDAQISEANDGNSAVQQLKENSFDLIILDVQMPNTNSFGLLEYMITRNPETKVLVFSMGSENLFGKRFIKSGAKGYLSKEAPIDEVKKAIETVLNGRKYISEQLIDTFLDEATGESQSNPFSKLSDREFVITSFLLSGLSLSEIANRLHLQPSTVGTYKSRIFEKLNISNLIQLKEIASLYNFSQQAL